MGSVNGPTGSVNGKDLSTLLDGYAGNWGGLQNPPPGVQGQNQYVVLLSNVADPCSREGSGSGTYAPNELTLQLRLDVISDPGQPAPAFPPADAFPLTFTVGQWVTTSDAARRECVPAVVQAGRNGRPGNATNATSGTVTLARADAGGHEGSYQLAFPNGGTAAGSFAVAWCGTLPS